MTHRFSLLAAVLAASPCFAQDPVAVTESEPSPLAASLARLTDAEGMSTWRLTVERAADEGGDGFGGAVVIGGPETGEAYEGDLQVVFDGKEFVVCTDAALPGFAMYRTAKGREIITSTMDSKDSIDVRGVLGDVAALMNRGKIAERVTKAVEKGKAELVENEDGTARLTCELPKSWLSQDSGGEFGEMFENPMAPKVLKVTARLDLGTDDALTAMRFEVTRSDPMAAIQAAAMSGEFGGGGEIAIGPDDIAAFADEPGPVTTFTLRPAEGAERAKQLLVRLRKLAGEQ